MYRDDAPSRWTKPESLLLLAFLAVLAWAPFPYGSNRLWAELVLGLGVGVVLLAWSGTALTGLTTVTSLTRQLAAPALCAAFALGWAVIQSLDLDGWSTTLGVRLSSLAHPVWSMASAALRKSAGSYISVDPEMTRQAIFVTSVCIATFLLAFELARDRWRASVLLGALVVIGVAYALMAFANFYLHVDFHDALMPDPKLDTGRLSGPFINPNHLATYMALCGLAALGLFVETLRQAVVWDRGAKIILRTMLQALTGPASGWLVATIIVLSALLLTQSRGGVISFLLGTVALIVALAIGRRLNGTEAPGRRAMAAFLILIVAISTVISADPILGRIQQQGLGDAARTSLAQSTLSAVEAAPLVGHGFGAFQRYYPFFADGSVLGDVDEAHNDVLETLADLGLPAGLAFMAAPALLAGMCLAGCLRRRRDRVYSAVAFAASITVGAHAFVDFSLQVPAVAVTYAALLGAGVAQSWRTGNDLVR
ncbi:MAG: O-antigen ligase family protein [Alphaproteobacteria bacterium]|nr:O-antigen ligase family protein [Alphaproteobacteria bacterium]